LRTIRVRILDPYGNGGDDTDRARVIAALDRWEETGIPLHFSVIDGPADSVRDADITVCWVRQFSRSYNGWTTLATDRGQIRRAAVVLALNDPHGDALSDAVRSAVAMHEMGHAIGLRHATDSTALMWPVAGARDGLSPSDVEAVRRLYFPVQQRERVAAASHASP
jgi:predicted Zn-dependent protease